jgi:hypothetical protein
LRLSVRTTCETPVTDTLPLSRRSAMLFAMRRIAIIGLVSWLSIFGAAEARADLAPANTCTTAGQSCTNAPPDYKTAGTCKASTCNRFVPGPDGARQPMPYDCTLCVADNGAGGGGTAGSTGAGGGAAAGAGAAGAAGATSAGSKDESGCNCVVSPARGGSAIAALMLAIGAGALLAERRARRG